MSRNKLAVSLFVGLTLIALAILGISSHAEEDAGKSEKPNAAAPAPIELHVEHDEAKQISRITIPSVDGQIAWNDVLRGLARAGGLDDAALRQILPEGESDITKTSSRYTILAINLALSPEIRLQVLPASDERQQAALLVTVDRKKLREARRNAKAKIRNAIGRGEGEKRFGLRLSDDWQKADPKKYLVLVLHGFNSDPDQISGLVRAVRESKLPLGTFAYPNDQPIGESAERLSRDLKTFASDHPERRLALVTHSMGALVARAAIEDPTLDPGNVDKLIMIAPPTHGSQLARISFGLDLWEHFLAPSEAGRISRFYAAVEDGLAEADNDLRPGSEFLRQLNARKRNEKVRYSLLLGTGGPLTEKQLQSLRDGMEKAAQKSKTVQLVRPRLREILSDFDEVLKDKGDGVVAVKRGRLEGVRDTVLLDFTHLGPTNDTPTDNDRALYEEVRKRLKE